MGNSEETGGFEALLGVVGFFAGAALFLEQNADSCGGALIAGLILGAIGAGVGKLVDRAVAVIIAIIAAVVTILVNAAIRRVVFEFFKAIFAS
jgi:hypothetical protein